MYQGNIRLEEAMRRRGGTQVICWETPGCQVKCDKIQSNANVEKTCVMKEKDGKYHLGIWWTKEGSESSTVTMLEEFSTLGELLEKYPDLYWLEGTLVSLF